MPKVTVLLPVYNGERYLNEAIDSILHQTFKDFEFLIINDGSTDGSADIVRTYDDKRIIFVDNNDNIGLIGVLNLGLDLAKGEYVVRMDQDDVSLPERIATQVDFMDSNEDCGVCGSWIKFFGDADGQVAKYETDVDVIKAQLLFMNPLAHPSTIIRKSVLDKFCLRYDEYYKNAEDYEFWTRVVKFSKLCNVPKVLLNYRLSQGQITKKYQDAQNKMVMRIRKKALSALGADFGDEDLYIHQDLGTYDSPPTDEFINKVEKWLEKIIIINSDKKIYSDDSLKKVIGKVYFDLLVKNIELGPVIIRKVLFSKTSKYINIKKRAGLMKTLIKKIIDRMAGKIRRNNIDPAKNIDCSEFEVDNWVMSEFVIERLIPVVGFHPFPLNELSLLASAVCYFKPTHIFEWGTHIGKSARIFYETAKYFKIPCEIHTMDLPDDVAHIEHPGSQRGELVRGLENVMLHQSDGLDTSLEIIRKISGECRPLFFVDGDHSYESVKRELAGIITAVPNAAILLHDTFYQSAGSHYNIGPFKAVKEVLDNPGNGFKDIQLNIGLPGMTLLYK